MYKVNYYRSGSLVSIQFASLQRAVDYVRENWCQLGRIGHWTMTHPTGRDITNSFRAVMLLPQAEQAWVAADAAAVA